MNASFLRRPIAILLVLYATCVARAAAPTLIPFQGRVTDQSGNAPTNAVYTLIFNLYDQAVGGNVLWTETHQRVGVIHGTVNVFLGAINPTLATNNFAETLYLGVTIDPDNNPATPDPEMVPRQILVPTIWAKISENSMKLAGHDWSSLLSSGNNPATAFLKGAKIEAQGITAAQIRNSTITSNQLAARSIAANNLAVGSITTNELAKAVLDLLVPPGSIMAFGGHTNVIPSGWLLCDGRPMASTNFPKLFAAIATNWGAGFSMQIVEDEGDPSILYTNWVKVLPDHNFNLPDLRGYFLRGVDGGTGRDPDAAARTVIGFMGASGAAVGSVQGDAVGRHNHRFPLPFDTYGSGDRQTITHTPGNDESWGYADPGQQVTDFAGASVETRPKNAYVHYIIKY